MGNVASVSVTPDPVVTPVPGETKVSPPVDRPTWLPEKFKTPEEFAKSYVELEKKIGQPATPAVEPAKTVVPPPVVLPNYKLDVFETEFSTTGKLSDDSYTQLATQGFPKEVVDKYIEGRSAFYTQQGNAAREVVFSTAGGEESYGQLITWAASNLTPQARDAYNASLNTGNHDAAKFAVAGLKAQFEAANGKDPTLVSGKGGPSGATPFRSNSEMVTAMSDPRYAKDEAYRADVVKRLEVSFN